MSLSDPTLSAWFLAQLKPHEPMLRAWLKARFSSGCDFDDIIQESFVRALQARQDGTLKHPKAFLFVTARNLALNQVRHQKVRHSADLAEIDTCGVLDAEADIRESISRSHDFELLTNAIQSLPTRCRQILTLRKLYGLSQKEVAAELGIAEHTVESQTTIALRKISEYFARHGCPSRRHA